MGFSLSAWNAKLNDDRGAVPVRKRGRRALHLGRASRGAAATDGFPPPGCHYPRPYWRFKQLPGGMVKVPSRSS